jgi:hypothetical protein
MAMAMAMGTKGLGANSVVDLIDGSIRLIWAVASETESKNVVNE